MTKLVRLFFQAILFCAIIVLDRITKYLALTNSFQSFSISFVSCNVTTNRGITWGLLHTQNNLQFTFISIIIAIIIVALAIQTYYRAKKNRAIWPNILILAGALSNMIDRIMYKGVIDFIEISCAGFTWPIFNVADISIVIGIACIIIEELVGE